MTQTMKATALMQTPPVIAAMRATKTKTWTNRIVSPRIK